MTSVAVVGGGPAGCACAALLARESDVVIFEEHPRAGVPEHCAGLLTDDAISLTGVSPGILSTLYGAEAVLPDGRRIVIRSDSPKARTVDRAELDSLMADRAVSAGAEYRTSDRVDSFSVFDDRVDVTARRTGTSSFDLLIGADGNASKVSSSLGGNRAPEYLRGMQADVAGTTTMHDDLFTVRLGSRYAPGFFAWEIPCGDFTRVGLCIPDSMGAPWPYLSRLLSDLNVESRVLRRSCGRIPVGRRRTMTSDRIMLVGDAASHVKPVSAGGLYPSMRAAPILCEVASSALADGDLSAGRLASYDRMFRRSMGRELDRGWKLRRQFVRMDDAALNRAGAFASRPDVVSALNGLDLDDPVAVLGDMLRRPGVAVRGLYTLMRCLL